MSRRKGRNEKNEKDRPLPPLLAKVGGNLEVRFYFTRRLLIVVANVMSFP